MDKQTLARYQAMFPGLKLKSKWKPKVGSRTWLAWMRIEQILSDKQWHRVDEVCTDVAKVARIKEESVRRVIGEMYRNDLLDKKGRKVWLHNGAVVDSRMISKGASQASYVLPEGIITTSRRDVRAETAAEPPPAEPTSRTPNLDRIRAEIQEEKLRFRPPPAPNENVPDEPPSVNPPNKEYTWEEALAVMGRMNRARQRQRRPPRQPRGY
jgi:hypothetical protein